MLDMRSVPETRGEEMEFSRGDTNADVALDVANENKIFVALCADIAVHGQ